MHFHHGLISDNAKDILILKIPIVVSKSCTREREEDKEEGEQDRGCFFTASGC